MPSAKVQKSTKPTTKAKKPAAGKPILSLPAEEKKLFLPAPRVHIIPAILLLFLPVVFVAVYVFHPWFDFSTGAVDVVIKIVVVVFLASLVACILSLLKFIYDTVKGKSAGAAKAKTVLTLAALLFFSLLLFSVVLKLILP